MTDDTLGQAIKNLREYCNEQIDRINRGDGQRTPCFREINAFLRMCDPVFASIRALAQPRSGDEASEIARLRAENEAAMLRLGSLGLEPKMPSNLADLCARLGAMGSHGHKGYPTHYINPDGPEAATAIEYLSTRITTAVLAEREACAKIADVSAVTRKGTPGLWRQRRAKMAAEMRAREAPAALAAIRERR